ncbi:MAG TPA: ATP-binding protein [Steroidobacteraceae bacterium]|nr:ATP-binding protein [Steroidobacteraceae bacterium]
MRKYFEQLWDVLQLDFRKAKLGWLLAGINVLLVILVVGGISFSAVGLLRKLADNQGLVRVQLAGATAREELRRVGEDTLTAARGLAARATLRRMVIEEPSSAVELFLRRACQTAVADVCAVAQGTKVLAQSAPGVSWREIFAANAEQGERFMASSPAPGLPYLGAVTPVEGADLDLGPLRVYVLRAFDVKLAAKLAERAGLDIRLVSYRAFAATSADEFTKLHSAALSDGRSSASRISEQDLFASSYPVFAATGEAIALIETRLPTAELDASVSALVHRLWITALVLGALAVFAAVWLGKQVTDPVLELTEAAARLGQGDFSASIPVHGATEVGVLARTMEDMRRNLVDLTGELRRSEAEAQAVLNGVVEGVFAVDRQRTITYLNPQAARLLGVSTQEAIGKFCGDVLKPCRVNGERPCDRNCPILIAREGGGAPVVEPLEGINGQSRSTVITSAAPVDGLQVQVIRDETDLEAVRRARDSVLANISHEFRTPLAAQLASIELLREGLESMTDSQRRELVMSLERGTHRLTRLIDNLLESVRIESGQLAIRRQHVTVSELIEDARELLGSLFELRKQTLEVDVSDELPWVEGDGPRLTQVFVNLMANANKYAPENSTVWIGSHVEDNKLVTWVEDEGPGVPEAAQGSIFDRFSRGKAEEPEPGGLGLGLWIVKSIVERHGGSVTADRTGAGRSRFSVVLPLTQESLKDHT